MLLTTQILGWLPFTTQKKRPRKPFTTGSSAPPPMALPIALALVRPTPAAWPVVLPACWEFIPHRLCLTWLSPLLHSGLCSDITLSESPTQAPHINSQVCLLSVPLPCLMQHGPSITCSIFTCLFIMSPPTKLKFHDGMDFVLSIQKTTWHLVTVQQISVNWQINEWLNSWACSLCPEVDTFLFLQGTHWLAQVTYAPAGNSQHPTWMPLA